MSHLAEPTRSATAPQSDTPRAATLARSFTTGQLSQEFSRTSHRDKLGLIYLLVCLEFLTNHSVLTAGLVSNGQDKLSTAQGLVNGALEGKDQCDNSPLQPVLLPSHADGTLAIGQDIIGPLLAPCRDVILVLNAVAQVHPAIQVGHCRLRGQPILMAQSGRRRRVRGKKANTMLCHARC